MKSKELTKEDIFRMFVETDKRIEQARKVADKQWEKSCRELNALWKEYLEERKEANKELDKKFEETKKQFEKTDKRIEETDRAIKKQFEETNKQIRKTEALFTSKWGEFVESLVEGNLISLLNERGIEVVETSIRRKIKNKSKETIGEIDIIAHNGDKVVLVEVKTTLKSDDVTKFIKLLKHIKDYKYDLRNYEIYGAMAYITSHGDSEEKAMNEGLLLIKSGGEDSSRIVNR